LSPISDVEQLARVITANIDLWMFRACDAGCERFNATYILLMHILAIYLPCARLNGLPVQLKYGSLKMRSLTNAAISIVLITVALASLVSMIATFEIGRIVDNDLYRYGLEFNPEWANPYLTLTTIVFEMGWFIIIESMVLQIYLSARALHKRRQTSKSEISASPQQPEKNVAPEAEVKIPEKAEENKVETTALAVEAGICIEEIRVLLQEESQDESPETASDEQVISIKEQQETEPETEPNTAS